MIYSVPIDGTESPDCTKVYRNPNFLEKMLHPSDINCPVTGWEIFQRGKSKNPDAPCLGCRSVDSEGNLGKFEFKSYKQVEEIVKNMGTKILNLNIIEPVSTSSSNAQKCYPIGIYSSNNMEWLITEQICNAYGLTIVPLYDTLGNESVLHILNETECRIMVVEYKCMEKLFKMIESIPKNRLFLKLLIVVAPKSGDKKLYTNSPVEIIYWDDLFNQHVDQFEEFKIVDKDSLNTISYTSGTSGVPKGVIVTHEMIACAVNSVINGVCKNEGLSTEALKTYLSYLPLAHLYERLCTNCILFQGGKIGIFSGNVKTLLGDAKELKPTVFASVPRVYQKIFDSIMNAVAEKSFIIRAIFRHAWNVKLDYLHSQCSFKHFIWDNLLFNKFKQLLGGEVQWMLTGSAPLNPEVLDSLKVFFGIPIVNAYGLTECSAAAINQIGYEKNPTHIGGPIGSIEFKLASIPELEYLVTDQPNPRGELCIRGYNISKGYFKNDKLTQDCFKDGWFYTGDIAELLSDGALRIIDRSKCIFKLAQGEYLSPERLENIFVQSPYISQAFVTGKSDKYFPVAVLVLDQEQVEKWLNAGGGPKLDYNIACKGEKVKNMVREEIERISKINGIKGFEKIHSFHIETEPFSSDNNLLTPTLKLRRFYAAKIYKDIIDKLYSEANS